MSELAVDHHDLNFLSGAFNSNCHTREDVHGELKRPLS